MRKIATFLLSVLIMVRAFYYMPMEIVVADSNLNEKIDGKVYDMLENSSKVPVYIFYEDINYSDLDKQVGMVTGINKYNMQIILRNGVNEGIQENIYMGKIGDMIGECLNDNKQGSLEIELASKYISEKRKITRMMFKEKVQEIFEQHINS